MNGHLRTVVALVLGAIGVSSIVSATVLVLVEPEWVDLGGLGVVLVLVVGALLVLAGVVTLRGPLGRLAERSRAE